MLTAVHFGIRSPGFFGVTARLLDDIRAIEPAFQVSAARFAFFVFLVASALPCLLDLHFMMRELRRGLRAGSRHFARCQGLTLVRADRAAGVSLRASLYPKWRQGTRGVSDVVQSQAHSLMGTAKEKNLIAEIAKKSQRSPRIALLLRSASPF